MMLCRDSVEKQRNREKLGHDCSVRFRLCLVGHMAAGNPENVAFIWDRRGTGSGCDFGCSAKRGRDQPLLPPLLCICISNVRWSLLLYRTPPARQTEP
ncbi:hypothetical protein KSP40_PGU014289 [Platanthera guangdongensis]|uniref:Uncharacterized protein n=1 Tax=Platanthera guangdongensis TaxID=2320717 RepID=A0ABR2MXI3_9ASPA